MYDKYDIQYRKECAQKIQNANKHLTALEQSIEKEETILLTSETEKLENYYQEYVKLITSAESRLSRHSLTLEEYIMNREYDLAWGRPMKKYFK